MSSETKYFSLHRRLLLGLVTVLSLLWLVIAGWMYSEVEHEVEELFDINITQVASILTTLLPYMQAQQLEFDPQTLVEKILGKDSDDAEGYAVDFIVLNANKKIISQSKNMPLALTSMPQGLSDYSVEHKKWRVFSLQLKSGVIVYTAEPYAHRNELLFDILITVLMPILLGFIIMLLLIWFTVNRSLQPLTCIADDLSQRDLKHLSPVKTHNIPIEIKPLVEALNHLFKRLKHAFDNERRFTADAAHELRTPLAGIKIQTAVASQAQNPQQRQQALDNINTGVDRATHLVEQLLALARMESQQTLVMKKFDLTALCRQMVMEFADFSYQKNIDLGLKADQETINISANADTLRILLRNLLDNALRYTPAQGMVTVLVKIEKQGVMLILRLGWSVFCKHY